MGHFHVLISWMLPWGIDRVDQPVVNSSGQPLTSDHSSTHQWPPVRSRTTVKVAGTTWLHLVSGQFDLCVCVCVWGGGGDNWVGALSPAMAIRSGSEVNWVSGCTVHSEYLTHPLVGIRNTDFLNMYTYWYTFRAHSSHTHRPHRVTLGTSPMVTSMKSTHGSVPFKQCG